MKLSMVLQKETLEKLVLLKEKLIQERNAEVDRLLKSGKLARYRRRKRLC